MTSGHEKPGPEEPGAGKLGSEKPGPNLARLYDLDFIDDPGDLDLYLALSKRTGGPILELGVGSGRVAVPLAEAGFVVTGVDIDPAMLGRARDRAQAAGPTAADRVELVEGDLFDVVVPRAGTFRLAFIALNSLLLIGGRDDQRRAVEVLAGQLAPGGLAVIDVWLPDAENLARFDGRIMLEYAREDPATGRMITKAGSAQHDSTSQVVTLTTIYEESGESRAVERWLRVDRLRLVSADELRAFAEDAGLAVETIAGDYDLAPLGPGSERAILVAAKPA